MRIERAGRFDRIQMAYTNFMNCCKLNYCECSIQNKDQHRPLEMTKRTIQMKIFVKLNERDGSVQIMLAASIKIHIKHREWRLISLERQLTIFENDIHIQLTVLLLLCALKCIPKTNKSKKSDPTVCVANLQWCATRSALAHYTETNEKSGINSPKKPKKHAHEMCARRFVGVLNRQTDEIDVDRAVNCDYTEILAHR